MGKSVKVQLWDTAGQERFRSISSMYYKNVDFVILIFDLTNEQSFKSLCEEWMNEVQTNSTTDRIRVLVLGNKSDLPQRFCSPDQIVNKLSSLENVFPLRELEMRPESSNRMVGFTYQEVSAKTGENLKVCVEQMIESILKEKIEKAKRGMVDADLGVTKILTVENQTERNQGCC